MDRADLAAKKLLQLGLLWVWDSPTPFPLDLQTLERALPRARFVIHPFYQIDHFVSYLQKDHEGLDCLVFLSPADLLEELEPIALHLCECGVLLPTLLIIVESGPTSSYSRIQALLKHERFFYHNASLVQQVDPALITDILREGETTLLNLPSLVDRAIALFLQLSPTCGLPEGEGQQLMRSLSERVHNQQQRLAEKLRERLGYMGVYYHRDPDRFFRHLSGEEQQAMRRRLRGLYQAIVLEYFQSPRTANARIDEFVALAFFADIGASQVLELHMSLMDDFAKQLKLEGRSEEILLDYRITLIDVIAHLSEMYRRSIPREQ